MSSFVEIYERIERVLKKAQTKLPGSNVRMHTYRGDGSIDAWLTLYPSRSESINSHLISMEHALKPILETWISVGFRIPPSKRMSKEVYEHYPKFQGLLEAFGYPRRNSPKGFPLAFSTAKYIWMNLKKSGHRKPDHIVVKVHYNAQGFKPKREDM